MSYSDIPINMPDRDIINKHYELTNTASYCRVFLIIWLPH